MKYHTLNYENFTVNTLGLEQVTTFIRDHSLPTYKTRAILLFLTLISHMQKSKANNRECNLAKPLSYYNNTSLYI